jgi:hypothetical protein
MERADPATYAEFWPVYLREHSRALTRRLHVLGTLGAAAFLIAAIAVGSWWLVLAAPVFAYGLAWIGHFFVEHNRPATFRHPLWSLCGDFHMVGLALTGRLAPEIARHLPDQGEAR